MKIRPVGEELLHAEGRTDRRHDETYSLSSQLRERARKNLINLDL